MKLRVLNIISGVLFFISSSSLLIIPFLAFDDNLSVSAYAVALLFWGGSISGIIIQIILFVTCKKYTKVKESKTRQIVGVIFLISVFVLIPITDKGKQFIIKSIAIKTDRNFFLILNTPFFLLQNIFLWKTVIKINLWKEQIHYLSRKP